MSQELLTVCLNIHRVLFLSCESKSFDQLAWEAVCSQTQRNANIDIHLIFLECSLVFHMLPN